MNDRAYEDRVRASEEITVLVCLDPFTDLLETLQQDVLEEVRGMWEAFSGFSRGELGIEPEKLMKSWLEPMWPEIETLMGIWDYPVVNEERVEEYALVLRRFWRKLTT